MSAAAAPLKLFSVVIPARDEEESLPSTIGDIHRAFSAEGIPHEIVVVDDGSKDRTWQVLQQLKSQYPTLAPVQNTGANGFGRAVVYGLDHSRGDAVVVGERALQCRTQSQRRDKLVSNSRPRGSRASPRAKQDVPQRRLR